LIAGLHNACPHAIGATGGHYPRLATLHDNLGRRWTCCAVSTSGVFRHGPEPDGSGGHEPPAASP